MCHSEKFSTQCIILLHETRLFIYLFLFIYIYLFFFFFFFFFVFFFFSFFFFFFFFFLFCLVLFLFCERSSSVVITVVFERLGAVSAAGVGSKPDR